MVVWSGGFDFLVVLLGGGGLVWCCFRFGFVSLRWAVLVVLVSFGGVARFQVFGCLRYVVILV